MKRSILFGMGALVLALTVGGALVVIKLARTGPTIEAIPVYPGAANVQTEHAAVPRISSGIILARGTQVPGQTLQSPLCSGGTSSCAYHGTMTFSTADNPGQVYSYYEDMLTRTGWISPQVPNVQAGPSSSSSGVGVSGPQLYRYDPVPRWLKQVTGGVLSTYGYEAKLWVSAYPARSPTGSDVVIVLDMEEQ